MGGGGRGTGSGNRGRWVGGIALTFVFMCTNKINTKWYDLYNSSFDKETLFLWVIVKH